MDLPVPDSSYKWTLQYVAFRDWLLSQSIVFLNYTPVIRFLCSIPLYGWRIFHCMDIHFVGSLLSWWMFGLFPGLAVVYNAPRVDICFHFIWVGARIGIAVSSTVSVSSTVAVHFTFPPTICEASNFSTSSRHLYFLPVCVCFVKHPTGCGVVALGSFDVHFPKDNWYQTSFHVLIGHFIYPLWREIYSNPLPDFKGLVILLVSCKSSGYCILIYYIYIFWILDFYQVNELRVFVPILGFSFSFVTVSFNTQKFLKMIKSNLFIYLFIFGCLCYRYPTEEPITDCVFHNMSVYHIYLKSSYGTTQFPVFYQWCYSSEFSIHK